MDKKPAKTRRDLSPLGEPELTLVKRGEGSDPRLVELVRLLARRAALELYEVEMRERGTTRS